ncbi:hypothetical protein XENOCAPTIV_024816, partial [Xenoophorus captivus]
EPILPENNIELAFDVKFDVRDIIEVTVVFREAENRCEAFGRNLMEYFSSCYSINSLRVAINNLLCSGPSNTLHLNPDRISQLQEDCRDGLTRLFIRSPPREAVTPIYHENQGKWNQVWYRGVLLLPSLGL